MRIRPAGATLLALLAWTSAGAQARTLTPVAPPGQAVSEGVEVYVAPPGPSIGSFAPRVVYQTSSGFAREGGELELGQPLLLNAPAAPASRVGMRRLLLASGQAAYASIDGGAPIALQPAVGPPYEIRAALYEVPGVSERQIVEQRLRLQVRLTDIAGAPLSSYVPLAAPRNAALETRTWEAPARPARGVCSIRAARLAGLRAVSGSVVSVLRPLTGAAGERWITCATTVFRHGSGPALEAWLLLDAEHPGRTPADIPSMLPVAGRAGLFEQRPGGSGPVAKRVRHGWLLVQGGEGLAQCLNVLAHLQTTVSR